MRYVYGGGNKKIRRGCT